MLRPAFFLPMLLCLLTALAAPALAQQEFKLDDYDRWRAAEELAPDSPAGMLQQARIALARNEAKRARALADAWLERYGNNPLRPDALMIRGDAKLALGDEYEALFDYEEVARRYPFSSAFIPTLEREYDIARAYAWGLKRKFFGTFRIVNADDEAEELLIRIQERLPGSALAEKAGMELADFYFRRRNMELAAVAYDLFAANYPRSPQVDKAKLRTIYAYYSSYKGPQYDGKGLAEAATKLRALQATQPQVAKQVGADALLVRVYQNEAQKLLAQANWYWKTNDPIATERVIRRLVKEYPRSAATIQALRQIDTVLEALPRTVRDAAPDYAAIRQELLAQLPSLDAPPPADPPVAPALSGTPAAAAPPATSTPTSTSTPAPTPAPTSTPLAASGEASSSLPSEP